MKKFVLAEDGLNPCESAADYAAYFSKEFDAHLVVAFLEEVTYKSKPVGRDIWWPYFSPADWEEIEETDKKDDLTRNMAIKKLEHKLESKGIHFNIHKDKPLAFESLLAESHFADAVIINANASFSNYDQTKPSRFIQNLLSDAGCPVILIPEEFKPVQKFVFAYDGSPSSAYAIRQFTYLFPNIKNQEVEIVFVTDVRNSSHLPHQHLLKELLKRRYNAISQSVLRSDYTEDILLTHLQTENKNCMVIMGAYNRSAFSMWLHHSMADAMIKELKTPVFIAHH